MKYSLALICAASLFACTVNISAASVPVRVVRLDTSSSGEFRRYFGVVQGSQRVNLSFRVAGPLVEFPVETGSRVKKNQLLALIDPRDFRTRLSEAQSSHSQALARYNEAQSNFRRYEELYKKQAVSQAQYDSYQTAFDVARSSLRTAEAGVSAAANALADTELRAPFSGVIVARMVENFQDVQAMQPVLSLQNLENVEIVASVPEADVATLAVKEGRKSPVQTAEALGAELKVTVDALPGQSFPAHFKEISTQSDPRSRTYKVTVIMTQPENVRILPGMTVLVTAVLPTDTTTDTDFAVPLEAIVGDISGHSWVWLYQEDGTVKKVPVSTGEFRSSNILVSGDLKAGDRIVSSGARGLRETSEVHIISE